VENKPGAGGSIGAHEVFKATPDGYTLLLATNTHIVNQVVYSNLGFDFTKDFVPIALVTSGPMVIAVNSAKVPAKDLREFIAMLKSAPGKYSYASCNVGSPHHFSMEMLKSIEHIDALHIPHKGCGPAVADTVAGHIDTVVTTLPAAVPFFKEGRLRPIALMSSTRSVAAPDIPTVSESGIPELKGFSLDNYYGFMAPPGTPQAIASRVEADVMKIAAQPEVRKKLENSGMDMLVLNAADMMKLIRADYGKYSAAAKAANIKAE
ncbi:MAG TPA: tripartite tricarboxylate transporter substrate-binding protein, partial [Burkholderiales bacterium]|nr:tripartite tricarboxylate transporter substrate-binding protein [Burkholderiales bacterium]